MGREHEIVKHFQLCAALMSDPTVLVLYPDIVADQFNAAKKSIEALGSFLAPRAADPCGCHTKGWMDLSVITKGVKHVVEATLAEQMGVVRMKEFPKIVETDFKRERSADFPGVNLFIREIKETNCMGSIVLLYYYLYWYLLLIRINKRIDSSYCTQKDLDISWLLRNLPDADNFLECRSHGRLLRSVGTPQETVDAAIQLTREGRMIGNIQMTTANDNKSSRST